jgi:uncharacterized membrane protein
LAAAGLRFFIKSSLKQITLRDGVVFALIAVVIVPFGTAFWGAAFTVLTGLIVAYLYGEERALLLNDPSNRLIGIGMWLALIMAFNVWFVIWPNQKKALGLVKADDAAKAKSARTAMIFSRINTLLSIPMLLAMTNAH